MKWYQQPARWLTFTIVSLLLAACQGAESPPLQATPSTPVADLPVSLSIAERDQAIPTRVADSVIAEADAEYMLLTNLYERSAPSVVNIEVIRQDNGVTSTNRGSGFIFDRNGHIITNAHMINGASEIIITFDDGFVTQATSVGLDVYSDLAVLRVDVPVSRLIPLALADSSQVRVGERAIAIGNPFGLSSSMTQGIVSALGRNLRSAELINGAVIPGFQNPSIIQVDTVINPGNSGGPLLNSRGEVIGVNTAIRTDTGRFQGVGFAVPSNTIARVAPELISRGRVDYSWMGISTVSSEDGRTLAAISGELGLPVNRGVLISNIMSNSPAQEAGLHGGNKWVTLRDGTSVCAGGDIIIAVNGQFISTMDELVAYLVQDTIPGDTVALLVVREGSTFEVPLTLRSRPDSGSENLPCGAD
jgi:S1-C subfamily serine protease